MGILDFFRKKPEQHESVKIKLSEIGSWLEDYKKDAKGGEKRFVGDIKSLVSEFVEELKGKIRILEEINVDGIKAEEKIKVFVKENLANYISHLNVLTDKLKGVDGDSERGVVDRINSIISVFEKRSSANFEKATLLIGKELGDVKESLRGFFKSLKSLIRDNESLVNRLKAISSIETKCEELSRTENARRDAEGTVKDCEEKIKRLKGHIKKDKDKIEDVKKSEEFLAQSRRKQELESMKEELEHDLNGLKRIIDFKALASFFHSSEKDMKIIKSYKEDFRGSFQKSQGEELVHLVERSGENTGEILNKIEGIIESQKRIESTVIEDTEVEKIESEIKRLKSEIESAESRKAGEEKRTKKIEASIEEIIGSLKEELAKVDVELE